jgi:hypothetical protein
MQHDTQNNDGGWIGTTLAVTLPMTLVSLVLALING